MRLPICRGHGEGEVEAEVDGQVEGEDEGEGEGEGEAKAVPRPPTLSRTISTESETFFSQVLGFLDAKRQLDAVAERVLPHGYMERYPSFKGDAVQEPLRASEANTDFDAVYEIASVALPVFQHRMTQLVKAAGLDPAQVVCLAGEPLSAGRGVMFTRLTMAPLKGRKRAKEKMYDDYGGNAMRLVDLVRCSIVVDDEASLIAVASQLADALGIRVLRLKNRFKTPPHRCD